MSAPTAVASQSPPTVPRPVRTGRLISRSAAARRLGVSPRSIDRYVERGLLVRTTDHIRRRVGINVAGIEAIEAARVEIDDDGDA